MPVTGVQTCALPICARQPRVVVAEQPVVSIVTPSYNQAAFLRRTIDSVLSQDYPAIEYRVVDGGSTDGSVGILRSYGDRVRWISEKDGGQTEAINKGFAQSKGTIRAYLNSDDALRPGAVAKVVETFRRRPNCDLVYGRGMFIDADDQYLGIYPSKPYSFDELMRFCCVSQPAAFWTKRIADLVGPFDESLRLTMDYDYWMRIDRAGGIVTQVDDLLAATRMHPGTKTSADCPDRFFDEIWRISLRAGNHVGRMFVNDWVILCLERDHRWMRPLRRWTIPLLYHWIRMKGQPDLASRAAAAMKRGVMRIPGAGRIAGLIPRRWLGRNEGNRPDNWLQPECVFHPDPSRSGETPLLIGLAPVSMCVAIEQGKRRLATIDLPGQTITNLSLPMIDLKGSEPIVLKFSEQIQWYRGAPPVSFQVLATNLYREG